MDSAEKDADMANLLLLEVLVALLRRRLGCESEHSKQHMGLLIIVFIVLYCKQNRWYEVSEGSSLYYNDEVKSLFCRATHPNFARMFFFASCQV